MLIQACFLHCVLWSVIVSGEEQIFETEPPVEEARNETESKLEIVCIQDPKAYCMDKPEGLEFNDGCRECQCKGSDAYCKTAKCVKSVSPTTSLDEYCDKIFEENKRNADKVMFTKPSSLIDFFPGFENRHEKSTLPGANAPDNNNASQSNSSDPFGVNSIFHSSSGSLLRNADLPFPHKPELTGPELGPPHMEPPRHMGPPPFSPHPPPGPEKFPMHHGELRGFDDFPKRDGPAMDHGPKRHGFMEPKDEPRYSKPWPLSIFDRMLGKPAEFHRQRMEFETGIDHSVKARRTDRSEIGHSPDKTNSSLLSSNTTDHQDYKPKDERPEKVKDKSKDNLLHRKETDKGKQEHAKQGKSRSTNNKFKNLFQKLFGGKSRDEKFEKDKDKEKQKDDNNGYKRDKGADLKREHPPFWPPHDKYPFWLDKEDPHPRFGYPHRYYDGFGDRRHFGPDHFRPERYDHDGPMGHHPRGFGPHPTHYRRLYGRYGDDSYMHSRDGYDKPDWREEIHQRFYDPKRPDGPYGEYHTAWKMTSGVKNEVDANGNQVEHQEESPEETPVDAIPEPAEKQSDQDLVEVPAGSFLMSAHILRLPQEKDSTASVVATAGMHDSTKHQALQYGDFGSSEYSVTHLMRQLELVKKELEHYKTKLKTCEIYRSRMRNALKTQLEQHNAGPADKSFWTLSVPLIIGALWWH